MYKIEFLNHRRLPKEGIAGGPGRSRLFLLTKRRKLRDIENKREMRARNQGSMVVFSTLSSSLWEIA